MRKPALCLRLLTGLILLASTLLYAEDLPQPAGTMTITLEEAAAANAAFQENRELRLQVEKLDQEFKTLLAQRQILGDAYDALRLQAETVVGELATSHKREAELKTWRLALGISSLVELAVLLLVAVLK